jgi:hypothetical protein
MTKKVFIAKREKKRIFERVYEIYSKRQGCQIFLVTTYQNWGIYNKLPHNIPNVQNIPIGRKIDNVHKICKCLPLQDPPKFTQIGIFGLKMYHLATLVRDDFE